MPHGKTDIYAASDVIGDRVRNMDGEDVGKIEDLVIDPEEGRIAYAVLSFGGVLGMGDKYFAIPWHSLRPGSDEKEFMVDIDKDRLKNAPGFDKDHWPRPNDRKWLGEVYGFYNEKKYWH